MIRLTRRIFKRKKTLIFLFVNKFIRNGVRDSIYKIFLIILIKLKKVLNKSFLSILNQILFSIKPLVRLKPFFASGIIYYLPYYASSDKSIVIALNWLVKSLKQRSLLSFKTRLMAELRDILLGKGVVLKKKVEYYKLILDNRMLMYRFRNIYRK
jgi:ribosomal protein S7